MANGTGTYGTLAAPGAASLLGLVGADQVAGAVALSQSGALVTSSVTTNAGSYQESVTGLTGAAAANYTLAAVGNVPGTLTVSPKPLTWLVANAASVAGTQPVAGAATLGGLVVADAVTGQVSVSLGGMAVALTPATPAGAYTEAVTRLAGSAAANYVLASQGNTPGQLTITAAAGISAMTALADQAVGQLLGQGSVQAAPLLPVSWLERILGIGGDAGSPLLRQLRAANVMAASPGYVADKATISQDLTRAGSDGDPGYVGFGKPAPVFSRIAMDVQVKPDTIDLRALFSQSALVYLAIFALSGAALAHLLDRRDRGQFWRMQTLVLRLATWPVLLVDGERIGARLHGRERLPAGRPDGGFPGQGAVVDRAGPAARPDGGALHLGAAGGAHGAARADGVPHDGVIADLGAGRVRRRVLRARAPDHELAGDVWAVDGDLRAGRAIQSEGHPVRRHAEPGAAVRAQ